MSSRRNHHSGSNDSTLVQYSRWRSEHFIVEHPHRVAACISRRSLRFLFGAVVPGFQPQREEERALQGSTVVCGALGCQVSCAWYTWYHCTQGISHLPGYLV